jgi:hypothetical protein
METRTKKTFNKRAFVALTSAFSGIGLPFTGAALHAYHGEPLSRASHALMAAHWSLGFIFVVFVVWHIILNRAAFGKHLRYVLNRKFSASREIVYATVLVVFVVFFFVGHAFVL